MKLYSASICVKYHDIRYQQHVRFYRFQTGARILNFDFFKLIKIHNNGPAESAIFSLQFRLPGYKLNTAHNYYILR